MKGDFSRFTFDSKKHYSRVLMQQGRVQLDADWNEQVAMLLHRMQTMARDLIGPFGGPVLNCGFEITSAPRGDFGLSKGRYYVGGLCCENDGEKTTYSTQPLGPEPGVKFENSTDYLVYLDGWEQYVNAFEDPDMQEKALGGADTAGRSKVVWRVRTLPIAQLKDIVKPPIIDSVQITNKWDSIEPVLQSPHRGLLTVKTEQPDADDDSPCIIPPLARFRGLENQLYRIEIHSGGKAAAVAKKPAKGEVESPATFKWSRENGSVIFPIASAGGRLFVLEPRAAEPIASLNIDDWVELIDSDCAAQDRPGPLLQVNSVDAAKLEITVKTDVKPVDSAKRPYLRRWDQRQGPENKGGLTLRDGAATIVEDTWLTIEDGIQIRFEKASKEDNNYRAGDYWYIPARTVDEGKISWAGPAPPDGVSHHYAPLGVLTVDPAGKFLASPSCLMRFDPPTHF